MAYMDCPSVDTQKHDYLEFCKFYILKDKWIYLFIYYKKKNNINDKT